MLILGVSDDENPSGRLSYAKPGDAEPLAKLVRRLAPMLLGVCKLAITDHPLAEDAV